jgi:hypothetical protein
LLSLAVITSESSWAQMLHDCLKDCFIWCPHSRVKLCLASSLIYLTIFVGFCEIVLMKKSIFESCCWSFSISCNRPAYSCILFKRGIKWPHGRYWIIGLKAGLKSLSQISECSLELFPDLNSFCQITQTSCRSFQLRWGREREKLILFEGIITYFSWQDSPTWAWPVHCHVTVVPC